MSHRGYCAVVLVTFWAVLFSACPGPRGTGLVVEIEPSGAVVDGARWRVAGGDWQAAGAIVDGLAPGTYTVEFDVIDGWYTPAARTVETVEGETVSITQHYLEAHADWPADTGTYDVTLADDTVYVDETNLDLLLEEDTGEFEYEFNAQQVEARGLVFTAGAPLLIHGIAARRIEQVRTDNNRLIVETKFAPLNEIITDGTVSWDYGIEFIPEKVQAISLAGKRFVIAKDDNVVDQSFTVGDFTYTLRLELQGATAALEFTVEKQVAGALKGKFVAKGTLARFRSRDTLLFSGGTLNEFNHSMDGLRGDVELSLVATASGQDFIDYKLPVPLLEFPFVVGAVPVVLKVGAQFVINASVPVDGSSRVTTGFTYDSDLGFSFNGVRVSGAGSLAGIDLTEGVTETGASGAVSASFGLGFPRVSLGIFGNSIVPWAQTAGLVGGSFTFTPPCQTADALFLGAAGIDLAFLGFPLYNGSYTFFEHEEELLRAGDCPEDSKNAMLQDNAWFIVSGGG